MTLSKYLEHFTDEELASLCFLMEKTDKWEIKHGPGFCHDEYSKFFGAFPNSSVNHLNEVLRHEASRRFIKKFSVINGEQCNHSQENVAQVADIP